MKGEVNVVSLFSGYGGIELGLKLAGEACGFETRTVLYVEREIYPVALLVNSMEQGYLDSAPIWSDVTTLDGKPLMGKVDILTGGFPCQPWSVAGAKRGTSDERWLWDDIHRLVCEIRPRLLLLENVPGLISGGGLQLVLASLSTLGYDAEWEVFSAAQLRASQRRERVFILAKSREFRSRGRGNGNQDRLSRSLQAQGSGRELGNPQGSQSREGLSKPRGNTSPADSKLGDSKRHRRHQTTEHQARQTSRYGQPFPPRPDELDRWREILAESPEVEPAIRVVANGRSDRVDQLRALGNGVVPVVAAYAFITLAKRIGGIA